MVEIHPDITLGRRVKTTRLEGMAINEVVYPPGMRLAPHAHEHANISILLAGTIFEQADAIATECRTCSVVFKPPRTVHRNEIGRTGARSLIIEIQPGTFQSLCHWSPVMKRYAWVHSGAVPELMMRIFREFHLGDDLSVASLEQLLTEVLSADFHISVGGGGGGAPGWLDDVMDMLHEEEPDPPRVRTIADAIGVHPVYLARIFRRRHRCTIAQYVRRRRLERAAHELSSSRKPMAVIALETGFSDQAHLCRAFKHHLGLTPGQYRRLTGPG